MVEFKIGDRVKSTHNFIGVKKGDTGTVVDIRGSSVGASWDGLRDGHDCDGNCLYGMGYYVDEEYLVLDKITNWKELCQ